MHTRITLLLLIALATSAACGRSGNNSENTSTATRATAAEALVAFQPTPSPAGPNSSEPQITASDRGIILSWIERAGAIASLKFAERTSSGWSEPATVASGNNWFLSYADPPTVQRRPDGSLVANWLISTNPDYEGSDLQVSYSRDNGKTWARPFTPHHDGTEQQHAFSSFFELPGGALGVIWLDGRDTQPTDANPEGGPMVLRYAAYDGQWRRTAEGVVDARACECCSTAAAQTSDGVLVAFRDRSDREIRDIAAVQFQDGKWTAAAPVHTDNWEMYGCPVNGPAVSARGRQAVAAWFTAKDNHGRSYVAFSNDAGHSWGTPIRLDDTASTGRVDVELLDDGSAVASWVEFADGRGQLKVRRVEPSGAKSPAVSVAGVDGGSAGGFPRMGRSGDGVVLAWTDTAARGGGSDPALSVKTAVAQLAR